MKWLLSKVVSKILTPKHHVSLLQINSYIHCKIEITLNNPMNVDHDNSLEPTRQISRFKIVWATFIVFVSTKLICVKILFVWKVLNLFH